MKISGFMDRKNEKKRENGNKKRSWKKLLDVVIILCLVITTAGITINKKNKSNAKESKAISATVKTGTIKESVSGTGTISYADSTDIVVPADLEMSEILVSEGENVKKGTLLATVDETSLDVCIYDVKEAISDLDSTITSEQSSTTTKYITADVSGTVEKVYVKSGDDIADVMIENGALLLIKNGSETIKVIGSDGVVSGINVSEGDTVSSTTKVLTIESEAQSGDYLQAIKDREELVSILEILLSIKKNGGVVAATDGVVAAINITDNSTSSGKGSSSEGTDVTGNDSSSDNSKDVTDVEGSINTIEAVTMTYLSQGTCDDSGSVVSDNSSLEYSYGTADNSGASADRIQILKELKAGAGRIEGTTKDMEYADKEDAEVWIECTDEYTEVSKGTWYVRYKTTDSEKTSESVEIKVTEEASDSSVEGSDSEISSTSSAGKSSLVDSTTDSTGKSSLADSTTDSTGKSSSVDSTTDSTGKSSLADSTTDSTGKSSSADGTTDSTGKSSSADSTTDSTSKSSSVDSSSGKSSSTGSSSSGSSGKSSSTGSSSSGSSGKSSSSSSSSSGGSSNDTSVVSTVSAFTIAGGDKMLVTMNVDELDILSMKEGLSAEVTLDAVENETYEGTITTVCGTTNSSDKTAQYSVEITFDKTDEMLPGMNASVAVIVEEASDVMTVPLVAVSDEGRSSYVYTGYDESAGELTGKTEVTLGMSDENNVEIKEGLSEGDTIYYIMQESDSSDSKSGRNGMSGMGISGMSGSGNMKMGGERPSGSNGGERPSGGNGERPSGSGKSKSN